MAKASEFQRRKRKELARMASIANKRIKRLKEKGVSTPALEALGSNTHFGIGHRKVTNAQVNNEYFRVKNFLDSMTSSLTGATKYFDELATRIGYEGVSNRELQQYAKQFFNIVKLVKSQLGAEEQRWFSSYRLLNAVKAELKNLHGAIDSTLPLEQTLDNIIERLMKVDRVNQGEEGFNSQFDSDNWEFLKKE